MGPMGGLDGMGEPRQMCRWRSPWGRGGPGQGQGQGGSTRWWGASYRSKASGVKGPSPIAEGLPDARDAHRIVCPPLMLQVPRENNDGILALFAKRF